MKDFLIMRPLVSSLLGYLILSAGVWACSGPTDAQQRSSARAKVTPSTKDIIDAQQENADATGDETPIGSEDESSNEIAQDPASDLEHEDESEEQMDEGKKSGDKPKPEKPVSENKPTPKPETPASGGIASISCNDVAHKRLVPVKNGEELAAAMNGASPGDLIKLADGLYSRGSGDQGLFKGTAKGSADQPIYVCGSEKTVLDGGGPEKKGYVLHLSQASYWRIVGIAVTKGEKGIMLDESDHNILDGVTVYNIGHEGVHFRNNSSHNTIQNSSIYDTGKSKRDYGEGVYIGSALSTIKKNNKIDSSDYNQVLNNKIGPGVPGEGVDAKEYSSFGLIQGNIIDGEDQSGDNSSESSIYIKGNDFIVKGNTCKNPYINGLKNWIVSGSANGVSGLRNRFEGNKIEGAKLGILIDKGEDIVVTCDNEVVGAEKGDKEKYSNVDCVN